MRPAPRTCMAVVALLAHVQLAAATTFYVSPSGSDDHDGTSVERPWQTCAKVNGAALTPGDVVLFQRGREWHERLQAGASGRADAPITYDAYGTGAKPKLWGSDVLDNARFTPAGEHRFACAVATEADAALADHAFLASRWDAGRLTITSPTDPRTDGKIYTACLRGNVIFSNGKSHLVFRNLVVDETAGQIGAGDVQGYGVRIEGGSDVLVESCEAYRCGRHHFAAINTTGFVGRHLVAAYVQPRTPGDNTAYVSYADAGAPVATCTSEWDDVAADHLEDGKGGRSLTLVSHGDHQGLVTLGNSTVDTKVSLMTAPVIVRHVTLRGDASIETFGDGVRIDGVTLLGSAAIDQWASDGTIQNCTARLTRRGGGPTGYGTAFLLRDKAKRNVVRFNTLVTGKFSCIEMAGPASATRWYGNIMQADRAVVTTAAGTLGKGDVVAADFNFYSSKATFGGRNLKEWQMSGFDAHALAGDPVFVRSPAVPFAIAADSPAAHRAVVDPDDVPPLDAAGRRRAWPPSIGALEASP